MSETQQYDCLIIGGGISGISFAHYLCQQGKKVLVIEKSERIGGQVQSPTTLSDSNYWRELGAHTCYNSYTHLLSIVNDLDCKEYVKPLGKGSYVIYTNGETKNVMSQIAFPSLLFNGLKLFFLKKEGKTVKEFFGRIVGNKNYEKLFTRLFRAVLSQNADDYPAESFLKRRKERFEDFPRKYTFYKGLHTILDLIVDKNNMEVIKAGDVSKVEHNESNLTYTINTTNGKQFSAVNIAFATDPQTTAKLVKELEGELANVLSTIPIFHSESMNVIVEKQNLNIKTVAGIIPISDEFHSAVSRDLVEDEKLRSFTFHFPKGTKNKEEKLELISAVLNISQENIVEYKEDKHILPSLRMQHINMAEQVAVTKKRDSIYILGNYFYGLSLEDCICRSSDEAKRFA